MPTRKLPRVELKVRLGPVDPLGFFAFIRAHPETRNWKNLFFLTGGLTDATTPSSEDSRYSFLGMKPHLILKTIRGVTESTIIDARSIRFDVSDRQPFERLSEVLRAFRTKRPKRSQVPGIDRMPPFVGGGIGYIGSNVNSHHDRELQDNNELVLPDMYYVFYNGLYVFDHNSGAVMICTTGFPYGGDEFRQEALKEQHFMLDLLDRYMKLPGPLRKASPRENRDPMKDGADPTMSKIQSLWGLQKTREALFQGDAWGVHFSQEIVVENFHDPFDHFISMTISHPARFSSYLNCENFDLIGHSSERFFSIRGRTLLMEPVCSNLDPTPHDYDTDPLEVLQRAAAREPAPTKVHIVTDALLDLAEGLCRPSTLATEGGISVQPKPWGAIMKARLRGTLTERSRAVDALGVLFPPVTTTGYPREQALKLMEKMERRPRGIFGGSLGYFGYDGNCDMCTITDTLVHRDGNAYARSGTLLVARSDLEEEYDLMIRRARAMVASQSSLKGLFPFLAWRVKLDDDEKASKYMPFGGEHKW